MPRDPSAIRVLPVRARPLPAPDRLEVSLPEDSICLLVDDGTDLPEVLAQRIAARGWQPVILTLPGAPETARAAAPTVALPALDEATVGSTVASLVRDHGPVGGLLYLHPRGTQGEATATSDRDALRALFLLAKALQPAFAEAAPGGEGPATVRKPLVTVTHLDGLLGLSGALGDSPYAAGTIGLTKTLRLEWPEAFCRAVDLDPALAAADAAGAILAEISDPDLRLAEVGYGPHGRMTLEACEEGEDAA